MHEPDADRGDLRNERRERQFATREQVVNRQRKRYVGTRHRRGARSTIGLQHGAIEHDLAFAESLEVDSRAQSTPDQSTDLLLSTAADPSIPWDALRARRRNHRVLAGHPAL